MSGPVDWEAEARRLQGLFDRAGEGAYDVLALIDYYSDEMDTATERAEHAERIAAVLAHAYDHDTRPPDDVLAPARGWDRKAGG